MDKKIYVDSLPCKIGWTTPLLLAGIVLTIAAGVLGSMKMNTVFVTLCSAVIWLVFFGIFAAACKNLPYKVSSTAMITAITGAVSCVSSAIFASNGSMVGGIITIVFILATLAEFLWVGTLLKKHYSSVLGEIGSALIKIVKLAIGEIGVIFLGIILSFVSSEVGMIVTYFGSFIMGIWILWVMLNDVVISIYQLLHWGHQEGVTSKDLAATIAHYRD